MSGDISASKGDFTPGISSNGGEGGWTRDLLWCQEGLHHPQAETVSCWFSLLCGKPGEPSPELNQVHAHLCQLWDFLMQYISMWPYKSDCRNDFRMRVYTLADPAAPPFPAVQTSSDTVAVGQNLQVTCTVVGEQDVLVDFTWEYPGQKVRPEGIPNTHSLTIFEVPL